jgi:hypothetical protein
VHELNYWRHTAVYLACLTARVQHITVSYIASKFFMHDAVHFDLQSTLLPFSWLQDSKLNITEHYWEFVKNTAVKLASTHPSRFRWRTHYILNVFVKHMNQ